MKEHLKKLTSDSAIYGISTIIARMLNFLLVPFYTNLLPPGEYGIVAVIYAYLAFLNVVFTFGLEPAYMRIVDQTEQKRRKDVFSSSFLFMAGGAALLAGLMHAYTVPIASFWKVSEGLSRIVPLAAWTGAVDAMNVIPFALLRMENKASRFATIKFLSVVVNIALNILFIAVLHMSVESIFLANLLASLTATVFLLPVIFRNLIPRLRWATLKPLLILGLPTLPSGFAAQIVQVIDKPIMQRMMDSATVGIYQANYKLGIFMMLVVSMFQYAWQPFYIQTSKLPDAKRIFARVMTYYALTASVIVMLLSLTIRDIVEVVNVAGWHLIRPNYWGGLDIVPIILFGYFWTGLYYVSNAGLLITKQTKYLPVITTIGAAVNIVVNLLAIPTWGMYGAALATLFAYVIMAAASFVITQRIYPIHYEYGRLARIGIGFTAIAVLWYTNALNAILPHWAIILVLPTLYLGMLAASGFFSSSEIGEMKNILRTLRRRFGASNIDV